LVVVGNEPLPFAGLWAGFFAGGDVVGAWLVSVGPGVAAGAGVAAAAGAGAGVGAGVGAAVAVGAGEVAAVVGAVATAVVAAGLGWEAGRLWRSWRAVLCAGSACLCFVVVGVLVAAAGEALELTCEEPPLPQPATATVTAAAMAGSSARFMGQNPLVARRRRP